MAKKDKKQGNKAANANVRAGGSGTAKRKKSRPEKIMLMLVFLALLLAVYLFIADKAQEAENEAESGETISVLSIDTADITELSWEYEGEAYTLIKEEAETASDETDGEDGSEDTDTAEESGIWQLRGQADITLDQSRVESLLAAISQVSASSSIEAVTDFTQYGLAEPDSSITVTVRTAEEAEGETSESFTLLTGGYVSVSGEYYAMLEGEDTVYTVDGDYMYDFDIDAAELEYTEDEE